MAKQSLATRLRRALDDFYNTGPWWSNGQVEKRQKALVADFPDKEKEIERVFDAIGNLSNDYSEFYSDRDNMTDTELDKAERELVKGYKNVESIITIVNIPTTYVGAGSAIFTKLKK